MAHLKIAQDFRGLHALVFAVFSFQALLDALGILLQPRDVRAHLATPSQSAHITTVIQELQNDCNENVTF